MQPAAPATSNWFERRLDGLRAHPTLGRPVRFYFRRREQLLYLAVGGWNTVFGYGAWALLQFLLGDHLHYLVVVVLSWPFAVLNAYLGYRYIVFRSRGPVFRELPRFSLVYLATLLVNLALLPVALRHPAVQHLRDPSALRSGGGRIQLPGPQVLQLPRRPPQRRRRHALLRSHCRIEGLTGAPSAEENPSPAADDPHCLLQRGRQRPRSLRQVKAAMQTLPGYDYEHLFIDNASMDKTVDILA